ncbi:MAG: restriction endonuclease [Dehalococcoidia bacterium]|nr:restriction endonuclease [Dehalococcoidia bacterium]
MAPVLQVLDRLGGSGRPREVIRGVADLLGLSTAQQDEALPSGQSRFEHRVHWARFYLVKAGYLESGTRGVWTLTEHGRSQLNLSNEDAVAIVKAVSRPDRDDATASPEEVLPPVDTDATPDPVITDYRAELPAILQGLPPRGFENFCKRLLREAGFDDVEVTGRSGDGGIDGIGLLQVNPLVSVRVLFQAKRYQGSVGSSVVRDFRGAMAGRSDNGVIITTGRFTAEARREAVRDGVPPIELMDMDRLMELCERFEVGLRPVQTYEVDRTFFQQFS